MSEVTDQTTSRVPVSESNNFECELPATDREQLIKDIEADQSFRRATAHIDGDNFKVVDLEITAEEGTLPWKPAISTCVYLSLSIAVRSNARFSDDVLVHVLRALNEYTGRAINEIGNDPKPPTERNHDVQAV